MPIDNHATSTTLLDRLRREPGQGAAWEEFVARYGPLIRSWCLRWGAQEADADDVTQTVLVKLLDALSSYDRTPGSTFRAWLQVVTQRTLLDLRRRRPSARLSESEQADLFNNLEARTDLEQRLGEAFDRERLDAAYHAVQARVAANTWQAFELTARQGLTGAEAARRLGMPVAHVFVARHRVQKLLQQYLAD
jgi:RNA polymerase sigma-70 factor (ECF subfamily)